MVSLSFVSAASSQSGRWIPVSKTQVAVFAVNLMRGVSEIRPGFASTFKKQGFHAKQETARLLGEAIDYARQAQVRVLESANKP